MFLIYLVFVTAFENFVKGENIDSIYFQFFLYFIPSFHYITNGNNTSPNANKQLLLSIVWQRVRQVIPFKAKLLLQWN